MADVGHVKRVFEAGAFGARTARSLYQTASVPIHASGQVTRMAKHVLQVAMVLRHLGRKLETNHSLCTVELLREVRRIRKSCKSTFVEIEDALAAHNRLTPGATEGLRGLFSEEVAQKLEAQMESQRSTIQVMIQTVALSKLGRSIAMSGDSRYVSAFHDEVEILKTVILENHGNVMQYQTAEKMGEVAGCDESEADEADVFETSKAIPSRKRKWQDEVNHKSESSAELLRMVPHQPQLAGRKLRSANASSNRSETPPIDEITETVRELLDRWTDGPALDSRLPCEQALGSSRSASSQASSSSDEQHSEDAVWTVAAEETEYESTQASHDGSERYGFIVSDDGSDDPIEISRNDDLPLVKRIWARSTDPESSRADRDGRDFLAGLKRVGGGVVYSKRAGVSETFFCDGREFFCFELLPATVQPADASPLTTCVSAGWISSGALDLLQYPYHEPTRGLFMIRLDLSLDEIRELVLLSYRGIERMACHQSVAAIHHGGYRERVDAEIEKLRR